MRGFATACSGPPTWPKQAARLLQAATGRCKMNAVAGEEQAAWMTAAAFVGGPCAATICHGSRLEGELAGEGSAWRMLEHAEVIGLAETRVQVNLAGSNAALWLRLRMRSQRPAASIQKKL